ncbi:hypothetical protein [Blastococcus brunescens]|uniref:Uncharacterized protein n=1 Tax=Blastococcus brunescens TaxID=1564165 RepID=A0ABZ1AXZ6_9ACTN|nr:hypothetical protein [Blastococcus sp. BMG 8361]WRL63442.1 hypothetical protein U6N30_27555 [Blastococcus sp. BMG 8361]
MLLQQPLRLGPEVPGAEAGRFHADVEGGAGELVDDRQDVGRRRPEPADDDHGAVPGIESAEVRRLPGEGVQSFVERAQLVRGRLDAEFLRRERAVGQQAVR